jgi:hypothetical protein
MKKLIIFLASIISTTSCTLADSSTLAIYIESIVETPDGDYLLNFKIDNPSGKSICTMTDSFTLEKQGVWLLSSFGDDFLGELDAGDSFDVSPNPYPGLSLRILEVAPDSSFSSDFLVLQDGVPEEMNERRLRIGIRYFDCGVAKDEDLSRDIAVDEYDSESGLLRSWDHGEVSVLISNWAQLP